MVNFPSKKRFSLFENPRNVSLFSDDIFSDIETRFNSMIQATQNLFDDDCKISKFSYPKIDIYDENSKKIFKLTIPGLSKEDVKVKLEENNLVFKYEKTNERKEEDQKRSYHVREIYSKSFCRVIPVNFEELQVDKIEAGMKDGILKIEIPYKEKLKEKKEEKFIEIK